MIEPDSAPATHRKRRFAPVVWGASAATAAVLVLGVTGTLSSWTSAIITNSNNSVASVAAVSLSESSGGQQCVDTATTADNTATCATINKYGGYTGTGAPLSPDAGGHNSQSVVVTLGNTGSEAGNLTLKAAACSSTAVTGTNGKPGTYPLCNQVLVSVACTGGTSYTSPNPVTLTAFGTETAARAIGSLASSATTDCTFTLTLPSTTPAGYASEVASQVLTWTLSA